jgi:mRNA-degrading endonuclease toxin of MazEF toxin-antitoxin module
MNRGEVWLVDLDPTIGEVASDEINKAQEGILKILGI